MKIEIIERPVGLDYLEVVVKVGEEEKVVSEGLSDDLANLVRNAIKEALEFVKNKTNFEVL